MSMYNYLGFPLPTHYNGQPLPTQWLYDNYPNVYGGTYSNLDPLHRNYQILAAATANFKRQQLASLKTFEERTLNYPKWGPTPEEYLHHWEYSWLFRAQRKEFMRHCENVIIFDSSYAYQHKVESILFTSAFSFLHDQLILLLASKKVQEQLHKLWDEGITFYKRLLDRLSKARYFDLNDLSDIDDLDDDSRASFARLFVAVGDLYYYKARFLLGHLKRPCYSIARENWDLALDAMPVRDRGATDNDLEALISKRKSCVEFFQQHNI